MPSANVILQDGDILTIDTGATVNGWAETTRTFYCGTVGENPFAGEVTRSALKAGIAAAVPGARLGDVGHAVQKLAEDSSASCHS